MSKGYATTATGEVYFDLDRRADHLASMSDWRDQILIERRRLDVLQEAGLLTDAHIAAYSDRVCRWLECAEKLTPRERSIGQGRIQSD